MRIDAEGEVAQDLRPQSVAQTHILESNQARLRRPPRLSRGGPLLP